MLTLAIHTHTVAEWLLRTISRFFDSLGMRDDPGLESALYVVTVVVAAVVVGWLMRKVVLWLVQKVVTLSRSQLPMEMLHAHLFTKCSHAVPPIVMMSMVPFALIEGTLVREIVMKVLFVYMMVAVTVALNSVIEFLWFHYDRHENTRNLPLKGIANTMRGCVWIITVIITVSVLLNKSPMMLLTGLGAFAAALMLIFKDSILGLVASIQLSQNDMLRIGDWIMVPDTPVNGIVTDMTLSTVKVRNFDNTTATCPPYALVQKSFLNWRGMWQSGARRLSYELTVENSSILPATDEMVARVTAAYPRLKDWVAKAEAAPGGNIYNDGKMVMNGSPTTNLGLFRAYISDYLINHPHVAKDQQMLVRVLKSSPQGTVVNVYFFTDTTHWAVYESVVSEIVENVTAAAPLFGLRIYTPVTGIVGPDK